MLAAGAVAASALASAPALASPPAQTGAVVLMYHRFGEAGLPSTNIRLEQFEAHLAELTSGGYAVLPLPEIVAALREGRALPERAVAITIDDAFASVYAEAWPRLREAALPFTLFVATGPLDRGLPDYMSWDQLRAMVEGGGVTIGNHGVDHGHMVRRDSAASRAEIAAAAARFEEELGQAPTLFAYPFGEYGAGLRQVVAEAGFEAAFGQHSGAAAPSHDRLGLPRFPFNETYGDLDRFRLAVDSLPLPVADVTPADMLVAPAGNPPLYGFTVLDGVDGLGRLDCFSGTTEASVERLGGQRFEVRFAAPLPAGRTRVNCTVPGPDGRWRWLGALFTVLPEG